VVIILFISRTFFEQEKNSLKISAAPLDHEHSTLLAERDQILNAIHELDLDFELGKMPKDEYQSQRAILLEKGAGILRDLDNLPDSGNQVPVPDRVQGAGEPVKSASTGVETNRAIDTRRKVPASDPNDELEALIANRRRSRNEKASGFCPKCGSPLQKSDQFCSKCGFNLLGPVSQ
jgi:hypothetical protein